MNKNYYILLDKDDIFIKVVSETTLDKLANDFRISYSYCCTRYCDELIEPYVYIQPIRMTIGINEFEKLLDDIIIKEVL